MSDDGKANETKEDSGGEGVSSTLVVGLLAALAVAGVALAYFFNVVSDQIVGLLVAGAFTLVLALMVIKIALDLAKPGLRYASFALVVGIALVALYPAKVALHLGHADASATLDEANRVLPLASGGDYRVLVSGHLSEGREARISYRIKSGDVFTDGALERQYMTRRARRGASIQVPEDHDLDALELKVPAADPRLVLEQITAGQKVLVQAYSTLPASVVFSAMAVLLLLGMFLEAKAPSNGTLVMAAAAAVSFYFIIKTANPRAMAWATLWGALLAGGGGAVFGSVLGAIGRKIFKAEPVAPKGRPEKKAAEAGEEG